MSPSRQGRLQLSTPQESSLDAYCDGWPSFLGVQLRPRVVGQSPVCSWSFRIHGVSEFVILPLTMAFCQFSPLSIVSVNSIGLWSLVFLSSGKSSCHTITVQVGFQSLAGPATNATSNKLRTLDSIALYKAINEDKFSR